MMGVIRLQQKTEQPADDIGEPLNAVTVLPRVMPAASAADPSTVPATRAPSDSPYADCASCTPRNPVDPMWTVLLSLPLAICWAIDSACAMGMA